MTRTVALIEVRLPFKHASDWAQRCLSGDRGVDDVIVSRTARTVTLSLTEAELRDLLSDADFYSECMGPQDTGDVDYRPAARRCLAALARLGHTPAAGQ